MFPASDDAHKDASSMGFLRQIAGLLHADGWSIVNVDVVIAAETPRLAPHLGAMREAVARALAPARRAADETIVVSVKPKRAEGLGAIGRAEGVAAWAVALLERQEPGP
jgi:2-C-methyl-D-erythritol 2,4-cyclodiphosphate synthase